jgi:hypothetical protein
MARRGFDITIPFENAGGFSWSKRGKPMTSGESGAQCLHCPLKSDIKRWGDIVRAHTIELSL